MAAPAPTNDDGPLSLPSQRIAFRGDIEGLRAVAVVLVLLYHGGLPVPGGFIGVDVFFVISGFLMTSLLLAELITTRRVSLRTFYARRARRLLPAAATVLAVTALLTLLLLPKTRWLDIGHDILASAFYVQNWRLAELSVDYQAQDAAATSPLLHMWSLAVEEQFYILWPLLPVGVAALIRSGMLGHRPQGPLDQAGPRTQRRTFLLLLAAMALVALASLLLSVWYTGANPSGAYYVTTTRLWELVVGGAIALFAGRLASLSAKPAAALGWTGLGTIVVCAFVYSGSTAFPGIAALLPVLGTAAVLAGGQAAAVRGPRVVLDTAPMRGIGRLSYSLYLWHWPLLAVAVSVAGQRSSALGTAVVAFSFLPAYLSLRYIEEPVRRAPRLRRDPGRSLALGGACTAIATVVAFAVTFPALPPPSASPLPVANASAGARAGVAPRRGAMVLAEAPRDDRTGAPVDSVPTITPDPLVAKNDIGADFCSAGLLESEVRTCASGDTSSSVEVALIGDSHAQQWTTPLSMVARARGWKLTGYTKSACPFVGQDLAIAASGRGAAAARTYTECGAWRDKVLEQLTGPDPPAMVVVSSGEHVAVVDGVVIGGQRSADLLARGFRKVWKRILARGTKVVVIADTPAPDLPIPDCVAQHRDTLTRCTFSRAEANSADGSSLAAAARTQPGVTLIDLGDALCPTERCAPVIGGVLVWRDTSHMTATYASTLAPRLDKLLPRIP